MGGGGRNEVARERGEREALCSSSFVGQGGGRVQSGRFWGEEDDGVSVLVSSTVPIVGKAR